MFKSSFLALALAAGIAVVSIPAVAEPVAEPTLEQSEKSLLAAYWKCHEISAETEGQGQNFPMSELEVCTKVSKAVQIRFFGDDFGKLHAWTVEHKRARIPK